MLKFAVALLLGALTQISTAQNSYSIYLPKHIRAGVPYELVVEILNSTHSVEIEAKLSSANFSETSSNVVVHGTSASLAFPAVPFGYDGDTNFIVSIVGKDSVTGEELFTNTTKKYDLQYQKKFLSIFIQSDKAIYKPSETIKFRAVVTTPDLLPFEGTATFKLTDPKSNIIIMEKDVVLVNGVAGSRFRLGRYSTLGNWIISYEVHGVEEVLVVEVAEYKLPKFSVKIKTDQSFLHPGTESLSGVLSSQFTFGQPVKGSASLEFTIDRWRRQGELPEMITLKFPEFDGSESFEIPAAKVEEILKWNPKQWSNDLKIFASVKDKNTGDVYNETVTIQLQSKKLKVEAVAHPANIKPGLPYVAYIKVTEYDGSLLSAEDQEELELKLQVEYRYPRNKTTGEWVDSKESIVNLTLGDDGIAILDMVAEASNFESINFNVQVPSYVNKDEYWASWSADRFESPSNTFLQVSTEDSSLTAGDVATLTIHSTEPAPSYRIVILSRGKLVMQEIVTPSESEYEMGESSSQFSYSFDVTTEMSPSLYCLVSFVRDDGEIVADSVKISVEAALDNDVTITTSTEKTDAGQPVSITVTADAGSYVGLRAIDQSVLLLKEGNDITREKIFEDLEGYGAGGGWTGPVFRRGWWPYPISGADVKEVFDNSGILVLTDALVYSKPPESFPWTTVPPFTTTFAFTTTTMFPFLAASVPPPMAMKAISAPLSRDMEKQATRTRSFFPESWIWTDDRIGPNGTTTFTYDTPDTITTWELSSFAVSSKTGLGCTAENSKITVFRNFFISLNLPPTMTRGEILNMRTTLFNYFDTELTVTVILTENEWYDLIVIRNDVDRAGPARIVTIPPKDSVTVVFPIKFKKVGTARIEVKALSDLAGDAVERKLVVKAEGMPVVKSYSTIFDRTDESAPESSVTFDVELPRDRVEGSEHVKLTITGNIIGSSLSNLGNLLKMPSGCGEQTMLSFAPDVYISIYLMKVGELVGEIKQKSRTHIREGYQNELRYQRDDGSFSAFGSSDRSGSTWLTGFVMKCFIAAMRLEGELVQASTIQKAVTFILEQQKEDGTFEEPGRVIHKDMQGGVESDETLAAYMLIALAEENYFEEGVEAYEEVEKAIASTQAYLESRIYMIKDTYTLSVVAYALALVNSTESGTLLDMLDAKSTTDGRVTYWAKEEIGRSQCVNKKDKNFCPFLDDDSASTSSIEITAYALLTYVKLGRKDSVMPIVRWLAQQRGAFGGYHSTQDTVMAIQALSTVAAMFADRPVNMELSVTHSRNKTFSAEYDLLNGNSLVLHMVKLPSKSGTVTVTGTGVGFADIQVIASYNLPKGPRTDEPFEVDVNVVERKTAQPTIELEVCTRINEKRVEVINGTGMFVITVTLPSGHTVDEERAMRDNPHLKLVELEGEDVTGYADELIKGETICMNLQLIRLAQVSGLRPQMIKVLDYYKSAIQSVREYVPDEKEMTDEEKVCAKCGLDCPGCPPVIIIPVPGPAVPVDYCKSLKAPCPVFSDGLFYDPDSHVGEMLKTYESYTSCKAPDGAGDSREAEGLPSTTFDGVNHHFLCHSDIFKRTLESDTGFTVAILMCPTEQLRLKYYTVFSIGSDQPGKPYVIFSKKPRNNEYWLRIYVNEYEYIVDSISLDEIPMHKWTHVVIRLTGTCDAHVFVNGKKTGRRQRNSEDAVRVITDDVTMLIGRSHVGGRGTRGNFKGSLSSIDFWSMPLSDEDIETHYDLYRDVMNHDNPILNIGLVHHSVPDSIRHCFEKDYSANEMESRIGDLDTACLLPTPMVEY